MRLTLVRYVSELTNWYVHFALKDATNNRLVTGAKNSPLMPYTFEKPYEAVEWVRDNCEKGSSVEWEGTTY